MTQEEIQKSISDRFIIVYSCRKMLYLKDNGFRYLFKCFNDGSKCNFWVFDAMPEVREALSNYKRPDEELGNNSPIITQEDMFVN